MDSDTLMSLPKPEARRTRSSFDKLRMSRWFVAIAAIVASVATAAAQQEEKGAPRSRRRSPTSSANSSK